MNQPGSTEHQPEKVARDSTAEAVLAAREATQKLLTALTRVGAIGAVTPETRCTPSVRALLDELARVPPLIVVLAETVGAGRVADLEGAASALVSVLTEHGRAVAAGSDQARARQAR